MSSAVASNEPPDIEPEDNKSSHILLVGNSFTFRKSTGYGIYSILKEIVAINQKDTGVDKFTHEGCSLVKVNEKYFEAFEKCVNTKVYDTIIMQGPQRGRYSGVYNDEMKEACTHLVETIRNSASSQAKIYFLSTHGFSVDEGVALLNDAKTDGLLKGWKRISNHVNNSVPDANTSVIEGGILESIFQKTTGRRVIVGMKDSGYDHHPSWFGAYCLAAAIYKEIFNTGISELPDYRNTLITDQSEQNLLGVSEGDSLTFPNSDDMTKINRMAEGSAAFEKKVLNVEGVGVRTENKLQCFTDGKVTYRSMDESIAEIDENGTITTQKKGNVYIVAYISATNLYNETEAKFLLKVN